ncbi:hypothetical protein LY78DRAFT_693347 [Colletotrichum sublineola]|nr:hypothetical protein LY78DRAFT_693347 [Colletotrichum sublineola]
MHPRSMSPNSSSAAPAMTNHAAAAPLQAAWERHIETVQHNASTRHPVFFTGKLRRLPSSLGLGVGMSPVAHGYVYQDGRRADSTSASKL